MAYTKEQLQTQLKLIDAELEACKVRKIAIMQPDYTPAMLYGEGVRDNHRARVIHDIGHLQNRKINVLIELLKFN